MGEARKVEKELRRGAETRTGASLAGAGGGEVATGIRETQKAKKEAQAAAREQRQSLARQEQQEKVRLAEAEDETARRRLLRRTGGRQSLIASR